jgi:hypothetical protein
MRSVRATFFERGESLPADDLIERPLGSLTHAITIRATPKQIWPWLAQMGAGRGGWYSYDRLDNGGRSSANKIVPTLQYLNLGMIFPALPGETHGFILQDYHRDASLVLIWPGSQGCYQVTWTFVLRPMSPETTRLIVRARGGSDYRFHGLPVWLSIPMIKFVHFLMQRKQLIGIANRVERRGTQIFETEPQLDEASYAATG